MQASHCSSDSTNQSTLKYLKTSKQTNKVTCTQDQYKVLGPQKENMEKGNVYFGKDSLNFMDRKGYNAQYNIR